jgi:hypothetical protein
VIEGACYFSHDYCWFFLVTEEQGRIIHRCILISARGTIEAREESLCGDGTWLGTPVSWGKCAAGAFLLALTDDGLCRVEKRGKSLVTVKEFPCAPGLIPPGSSLYPGKGGLYAVAEKEIVFLTLCPQAGTGAGTHQDGTQGEVGGAMSQ